MPLDIMEDVRGNRAYVNTFREDRQRLCLDIGSFESLRCGTNTEVSIFLYCQ